MYTDATCFPSGANAGSKIVGIVISKYGDAA